MSSTDRTWESYGSTDPYYGVLTDPQFLGRSLDDATRARFFTSGDDHVFQTMTTIRRTVAPGFSPTEALDFGCGVGRLAIPLARQCRRVVGVDISASMLAEAEANSERFHIRNLELVRSDDKLSGVQGTFDLVHTALVMQHIPTRRGFLILVELLARLRPGGVGVIHVTYASLHPPARRLLHRARTKVPVVRMLLNVIRGRPARTPLMQMNNYDLGQIARMLQRAGCPETFVEFTNHSGFLGAVIYFRRALAPSPPAR